eukprot:15236889-Alexandrium_andersonii.AAC.1
MVPGATGPNDPPAGPLRSEALADGLAAGGPYVWAAAPVALSVPSSASRKSSEAISASAVAALAERGA